MDGASGSSVFAGEVAIVTGASSGIGRATAARLAAAGARVAACARSAHELEALATESGGRILAVPGDLGAPGFVDELFSRVEATLGPCSVLVNNAGHIEPAPVVEMSLESWDRHFDVNARAAFLTCRRALPAMIARRHGAIVNVASISGVPGPQKFPGFAAYCAAKAALISFTEALAVEVKEHGVRVNCVSPGSVGTEMLSRVAPALSPDMSAEEVADVILFLASPLSRPVNGQNFHVFSS